MFVALIDRRASLGLMIEIGWASALNKQLILLVSQKYDLAANPMLKGLDELPNCELLFVDETPQSVQDVLERALMRGA